MYIPINVTLQESNDPNILEQLANETTNTLRELKELKELLNQGTELDLDNDLADEIRKLDTDNVSVELVTTTNGQCALHIT